VAADDRAGSAAAARLARRLPVRRRCRAAARAAAVRHRNGATQATLRALSAELGTAVDLRRFRTNVHLDLDADAWVEEQWPGATLHFAGGVTLRLLHPCERCAIPTRDPATQEKWPDLLRHLEARHGQRFGVNARVMRAGRIHEGERVELAPR
jgi:uncharacterized protein YcbX